VGVTPAERDAMKVAVGADEVTAVAREVLAALRDGGHEVEVFGPLADADGEWVDVSAATARAVASGACERGVVMCWSGTGASIAANKVPGVRAALCADAPTARMAREYNHANVLALSMRLTSPPVAREIVDAFLSEPDGAGDFNLRNLALLGHLDTAGAPDLAWPRPDHDRPEVWLEDLPAGTTFASPPVEVGHDAMVAFAGRYDPQPFHLDPTAGAGSVFGGLVSSGWFTMAITMRLMVDHGPRVSGGLVGLGVEEVRWKALHPGAHVHLEGEVIDARRSRNGAARGVVRLRVRTLDAAGEEMQQFIPSVLVPARSA